MRPGIACQVICDAKGSESPPAFGVYHAFGYALPVLMRQFFNQLIILHQDGPTGPSRQAVLIGGNGGSRGCRESLLGHDGFFPGLLLGG